MLTLQLCDADRRVIAAALKTLPFLPTAKLPKTSPVDTGNLQADTAGTTPEPEKPRSPRT